MKRKAKTARMPRIAPELPLESRATGKSGSSARRKLEAAYKASYAQIPDPCQCAACGVTKRKATMERHHPAGRRKTSFLFTFMLCPECHKKVHDNPKWAALEGLLWTGRNSRVFTLEDAIKLSGMTVGNTGYAIEILKQHQ